MSIASYSVSEAAVAAQTGTQSSTVKKPPPKRQITAIADTTESPEPR